jgi:CO/xanthine dehydrogenase Mo-binding subunit
LHDNLGTSKSAQLASIRIIAGAIRPSVLTSYETSRLKAHSRGFECRVVGRQSHDIKVHRIVCAVDCGLVINPRGLEGQAESGITWGLSATLHGGIDFRNGGAVQTGYTDFTVIGIDEAPAIETYIVESDHPPGGFGETAVPPVAPAVANTIFAATGKRMRQLAITAVKLSKWKA